MDAGPIRGIPQGTSQLSLGQPDPRGMIFLSETTGSVALAAMTRSQEMTSKELGQIVPRTSLANADLSKKTKRFMETHPEFPYGKKLANT